MVAQIGDPTGHPGVPAESRVLPESQALCCYFLSSAFFSHLSLLASAEALGGGDLGDDREVPAERRSRACLVLLCGVPENSSATYVAVPLRYQISL